MRAGRRKKVMCFISSISILYITVQSAGIGTGVGWAEGEGVIAIVGL